jgi:hypothetical protein
MNSSIRALSLVFASAALMLGPGQAVAGSWGQDDKFDKFDHKDDRKFDHKDDHKFDDKFERYDDKYNDKYDNWKGPNIKNLRACIDNYTMEVKLKWDVRDDKWYNDHKDYYHDDLFVELEFGKAEAVCAKFPGNGKGKGKGFVKHENIDGLCVSADAYRTDSCRYEAKIRLDDVNVCHGNRELVDIKAKKALVRIGDYEECEVYLSECNNGW